MSGPGTEPLFIDTGAFYARFVANAPRHGRATEVFDAIRDGRLRYRPLYTSWGIVGELVTLVQRKTNRERAIDTLERVRDSDAISILQADAESVTAASDEFCRYEDQQISFVDHTTAVLATERDVESVFTFDADFRTLGFQLVLADVSV